MSRLKHRPSGARHHRHRRRRPQRASAPTPSGRPPRRASAVLGPGHPRGPRAPAAAGRGRGPRLRPGGTVEERYLVQTDRFTHFAMAAADLALDDAGLDPASTRTAVPVGVVTAAGSGGGEFGQRELQRSVGQGAALRRRRTSPSPGSTPRAPARSPSAAASRAPAAVVASDEAGGLDALAHAAASIRARHRAVVVGAAEAPLAPYSVVCQLGYEELSLEEDPDRRLPALHLGAPAASCPPRAAPCSWSRTTSRGRARGARPGRARRARRHLHRGVPLGGVPGGTGPRDPRRPGEAARCAPEEVDVVFADALGIPAADRAEALALGRRARRARPRRSP